MDIKRLETNLDEIKDRISERAELVAVTKTVDTDTIKKLISLGLRTFGENRINDAELKIDEISSIHDNIRWHMIGHLQSNKAKKAVRIFDVIESVDSLKLAKLIDKEAGKVNKIINIMIQVNISGEEQKYGINPEEVDDFLTPISGLQNIRVIGLMAMAPFVEPEAARPYFRRMKQIFDSLKDKYNLTALSMGMTNDYAAAIEEGSNMVRIGTALFR